MKINLNGAFGCLKIERMASQYVLQSQQSHVGPQRHFPHTIRVEIELVFDNFREVLLKTQLDILENVGKKRKNYPIDFVTFLKRISVFF